MSSAARRLAPAVLVVVVLTAAAWSTAAAASRQVRVCRGTVAVLQAPGGYAIAYVYRGNRVRLIRTSPSRRWALLSTRGDLRGWVPRRALCGS